VKSLLLIAFHVTYLIHVNILQIDKDFELMYGHTASGMFEHWPHLAPKVLQLVTQTVKDKHVQQIVSSATTDVSSGERNKLL